jgi:hypothetical protein
MPVLLNRRKRKEKEKRNIKHAVNCRVAVVIDVQGRGRATWVTWIDFDSELESV